MKLFYVYILTNSATGQPFYVGKGVGNRMFVHVYDALSKHKTTGEWLHNKPHHEYIRQLMLDGISIKYTKTLECESEAQALTEEKRVIATLGRVIDQSGCLLNISRGGQQGGETCKPVSQYTIEGQLVATYPSALIASESVPGANRSYITQVCKGKRKSAGGFLWTYEGRPRPKYIHAYHKGVDQYDINGNFIASHRSMIEAAAAAGTRGREISKICNQYKSCYTAGGYIWSYANVSPRLKP